MAKIKKSIKLTVELDNGPEKVKFSVSPVGKDDFILESEVPATRIPRKLLDEMIIEAQSFRNAHMKDEVEEEAKKETGSIVNLHPEHE